MIARLLSGGLAEYWEYPVVVDDRPGAETIGGTNYVGASRSDGHTLGFIVTAFVIDPAVRRLRFSFRRSGQF
jgi:tripartite-type tricarboxylate transporter receptor subunit TctC